MLIRAYSFFLFSCLLVAWAGCASKTEVTQQAASPQQGASPQQVSPGSTSNTQGTQQQQNVNSAEGGAAPNAKVDACSLISNSEVEAVQGEPVKETKSTDRSNSSFVITQCFYSLATYNKSVSLQLTRSKTGKDEAKEFWNHTFHKEEKEGKEVGKKRDREEEEEAEKERERREGGEEEEGAPPEPVSGVGDEAFWAGSRVTGALYVLKGESFIRISIGGPGDEAAKIEKLKALARKALARM